MLLNFQHSHPLKFKDFRGLGPLNAKIMRLTIQYVKLIINRFPYYRYYTHISSNKCQFCTNNNALYIYTAKCHEIHSYVNCISFKNGYSQQFMHIMKAFLQLYLQHLNYRFVLLALYLALYVCHNFAFRHNILQMKFLA